MKQAIIDIGSNSIRLTLYETEGEHFKTLFREKIMAGLAGYVENRTLSAAGIECACSALLNFQSILQTLKIDHICVFATASLRNISNTGQARSIIRSVTGYDVEILSGEEEALLGYTGAMQELHLASGAFLDIGGASTEIVTFHDGTPVDFTSFPIGSLSLYRRCVKKILPGTGSLARLRHTISETIDLDFVNTAPQPLIVGVGGTARAALRMIQYYYGSSETCRSITAEQLDGLCEFLTSGKKAASDLILQLEADRVHTLIPGLLVLQHVFHLFQAQQLIVSKYGVREGYLCERVLKGAVALANIFCWAAALLYAQMASKSVTFSMPFFINAVHSQASLSACLISGCFVFNYQNLCPF